MIPPLDASLDGRLEIKRFSNHELDVEVPRDTTNTEAGRLLRAHGIVISDEAIVQHPRGYAARGYIGDQPVTVRIDYA